MNPADLPDIELNAAEFLRQIKDKDKALCIKFLIEEITEEGIINDIRKVVNDDIYDD